MKYDFTTLLNRKGHDALALDVLPIKDVEVDPNFSTIPMWVADMNYPVFENIQKQMIERINEPHFGYFEIPVDYYKAIQFWQKEDVQTAGHATAGTLAKIYGKKKRLSDMKMVFLVFYPVHLRLLVLVANPF